MFDEVNALRAAAGQRDWNELQTILTRLFLNMDFYDGLVITVTRAHDFLPMFEAAHPGASWARELLVSIVSYGVAPAELPPEALEPHPSPGAANYITALFDVCRAVERRSPLENRVRFLANALSNILLAELAAEWYGDHPNDWTEQQARGDEMDPATGLTVRQRIYTQFWLEAATAARDTAAWLSVADAIEQKLNLHTRGES